MVDIRVDPAVLVSDGDQLYSIANTLRSNISSAASQLRGTDGMAGSDPVAEEYAEIYDGDAPKIIEGAWSLVEALRGLDSAVAATALGYDAAGNVGIGQQGSTIPVPQHGSIGSAPTIGQAMGAGIQGDFLGIDIGMVAEWVEDALAAIGIIIPNGDTGALATAASAWNGLRDDLSTASGSVSGSFAATQSMDLPQSGDMLASRDRIAELLTALSGNAGAMGEGCTGFIETIEQMRTELAWMVGQLVAEVLLDIGLSVALGFLTAGIGAAAGAAKAATTIARWVQRIAELIVETAQKIRRLKLWMRGLIRAAAEGLQGAVVSVTVQAAVNQLRAGDSNYEQVNLLQTGFASFAGGAAASPVGNFVAGRSGAVRREILGGVAEGVTDGAASSAVDAMWEGKPWDPWQDMVLGGILGGALRPALSNLPSPSLGGSGSGNPSANAGTIGVPTVTGADTSGGTSTGPAGGNAPSTQSNAPQPGVGTGGGGGSQPAGGNGVNVPDNSAPQPGVGNGGGGGSQPSGGGAPPIDNSAPQPGAGDGGGSQPAPSNAPEVPSGDVPSPAGDAPAAPPADAPAAPPADAPAAPPADAPAAPPADGPAAPPADAPAAPPTDGPTTPPADAPAAPPADGPATPPADAPAAPPADGPAADASSTVAPASDVPAADAPGSDAPASDAPPADGTTSDAFGIPVVDLPNLPDALPSSAPSGPESPSSTGDASTTDASSTAGDAPQAAGPLASSTPATVAPSQPAADADAPSASEVPSDAPGQDGAFPPASDADAADSAPAEAEGPAPADADGDDSDAPIDIEDAAAIAGGSAAFVAAGTVASGRLPNLFDSGRPAPDGTAPEADGSTPDTDRGGDSDDASIPGDDTSTGDSDATADEPTLRGNEPSTLTIEQIDEALEAINPRYDPSDPSDEYGNNCGRTSSILNAVLNGAPVQEAGTGTLSTPEMEARTGLPQTEMTPSQIVDALTELGAGSHAVVGIDRATGAGHWFNAYFDGTRVWTLDAQTGTRSPFPPDFGEVIRWDASIDAPHLETSSTDGSGTDASATDITSTQESDSSDGADPSVSEATTREAADQVSPEHASDGSDGAGSTYNGYEIPPLDAELRAELEALAAQPDSPIVRNEDGSFSMADAVAVDDFIRRNPLHRWNEFTRQVRLQQNGLNDLTVAEWRHNRDFYDANGRVAQAEQAAARQELIDAGVDMSGRDILHGPDQVGGGRADRFDGDGASGVNRSLGSQWRTRVDEIDALVDLSIADIDPRLLPHIRMNVELGARDLFSGRSESFSGSVSSGARADASAPGQSVTSPGDFGAADGADRRSTMPRSGAHDAAGVELGDGGTPADGDGFADPVGAGFDTVEPSAEVSSTERAPLQVDDLTGADAEAQPMTARVDVPAKAAPPAPSDAAVAPQIGEDGSMSVQYSENTATLPHGARLEGDRTVVVDVGGTEVRVAASYYVDLRVWSVENPASAELVLGRFAPVDGDAQKSSYVQVAHESSSSYFSMGEHWDGLADSLGMNGLGRPLNDDEMFSLFNVAVLEDAVRSGKAIRFSHDPELVGRKALWREWQHLKNRYGYDVKYEVDGAWYLARSSD